MKLKLLVFLSIITLAIAACRNNDNNNTNTICCDDALFFYGDQDSSYRLVLANVITPNADGFNDSLVLFDGYDTSQIYRLEIFDGSNNSIFLDTNYINDWTGKDKNGNPLPDGKYSYELHYGEGSVKAFVCLISTKISASSLGDCKPFHSGDPLLQ